MCACMKNVLRTAETHNRDFNVSLTLAGNFGVFVCTTASFLASTSLGQLGNFHLSNSDKTYQEISRTLFLLTKMILKFLHYQKYTSLKSNVT